MLERHVQISLLRISAAVCALLGWACVIYNFTTPTDAEGLVGIMLMAVWAVLRVRSFICELAQREVEAFELGRRAADAVRSIR